ncbi:MAG: DNA-directed RNA polymerase subunit alpha C-terminal domain-containing protein [Phycisphaeraceae bacterium]
MSEFASETATAMPHDPQAAEDLFKKGREAEARTDRWEAIRLYRQAFEAAPEHREICFRLAYHLDLVGEEDEALELFERACEAQPAPLNAMINLALLYEDEGRFVQAERLLKMVVETDPNHARGRLFLKDVSASRDMYYDEESQRIHDKQTSLLETPVTDFELSARARNCLKKMNIRTLGDLLRVSEAELMAYKNFGESTLNEIKDMLSEKGLQIGQSQRQMQQAAREQVYTQLAEGADESARGTLDKPVEDLDLSVRARKAIGLLNISTIGDLVARTEAELLGIKNFGQTSLDEIVEKLAEHDLSLRKLDEPS